MRVKKRNPLPGASGRLAMLTILIVTVLSLGGCMYPKSELKQNQAAPKEAVRNVQAAIDQYQSETGMLPMKNSSEDTPVYEKFQVDFTQLKNKGYLSSIPTAAFENGGHYYFLIINEETKPQIKLMNLLTYQQINDIQSWVNEYKKNHDNRLPKGEPAYPGYSYIDYKTMNKKAPDLHSDYSFQTLAAIMDESGRVYADYGIDIMQAMQKKGEAGIAADTDLRAVLVDSDMYVPVKAPVYHWVNHEPQAVSEQGK
ncbi:MULTISPECIES: DUF3939 domain-containing protein [unclassified Paenibacillus]|uniref:DUF3939 domain-containing protein n=1 Tax=unclassified Paenibacillus TaxID=185978 RepID=UPI00104A136A|nr:MULTISPECIES: DUF3939 domain-containing protein [unclassified Paenibacillus]NIK67704.1 hypothetical protein [Paenibacillus sp. BK720]TCN01745.1 uncharacterized protein DUF3939 [Paenibacillus sp. BK033]